MSIFASFHEQQMSNMRINDHMQESRAEKIDAMANDLYAEKLQALPNPQFGGTAYQARAGYRMRSVLDDIDDADLVPAARALIAGDEEELGRIFAKLIKAQLRKDAEHEADSWDDENHPHQGGV